MDAADDCLLIQLIWEGREETFDGSFHMPTVLLQKELETHAKGQDNETFYIK